MSPTVRAVLVVFIVAVVLVIGAGAVGAWVYVSRPPQPGVQVRAGDRAELRPELHAGHLEAVTVAGRLGQSSTNMIFRRYGHVMPERDRAAAESMGSKLRPPVTRA